MPQNLITTIPIPGIPPVQPGDNLPRLILAAASEARIEFKSNDVLAVCQKVVSKAEGAVVPLADVVPSPFAEHIGRTMRKDPRVVEVILRESRRIVRMDGGHIICETGPGWVCANAGVDSSNSLGPDTVVLLPRDADASAEAIRKVVEHERDVSVGVIITDTFGRPWREGLTEVALGVAGIEPLLDLRGRHDLHGQELLHTTIAIADDIACAAGLVMLKDSGIAAAIVRGAPVTAGPGGGWRFVRPRESDLFR
jgi:coenzyme F420-0:L-glutamate ligase/coenzyme F420-1:gamma-L-glutamate ligase